MPKPSNVFASAEGGPYPLGQELLGGEGEKCNEMGLEDLYTNYVTQHCSPPQCIWAKRSQRD